jgi:hypothetical protein
VAAFGQRSVAKTEMPKRKRSATWLAYSSSSGDLLECPRLKSVYLRAMAILAEKPDPHVCASCLFDAVAELLLLGITDLEELMHEGVGRA